MKGFCPLASGSKGNCIYFGTSQTKVLIDAGISARAIQTRLAEINVDLADIDAILITHEHTDHIQGLKVLAYKMGIPVFANHDTAKGIVDTFHDCPKFKIFSTGETFEYGDIEVHPFSIQHDTLDPVAFTIRTGDLKLGFCTDLGFATSLVQAQLQACDYLYLEANHQPSMVHASPRPMIYKQRVLSRSGHLSNEACGNLLAHVYHPKLKHVHLAHLSSECNSHETALSVVRGILQSNGIELDLCVAPQEKISKAIYF
ncbi:Metallo-beta-lactamase superfamily protein [Candidatus Protochlamydia naegleriophila]|uniref:Metallo-beta-lactamase superfamily protein n=1 Tax=Candidatus Protochlamydia naegleriophila TaxID=389348 RepID=A0A0U5K5T9_9BACT|nr:MBL fold metallo-hydrolase [Candidatus Protochlamydia naegleriophila]CUI17499.1 Metallo-beta-lactamase superfamily protein [Candidatus Protochlamydia naegleriophila]